MVLAESEHELTGPFEQLETTTETVTAAFESFASAALAEAQRDWPWDTGTSHDAWEAHVEREDGGIVVTLSNSARSLPNPNTGKGGGRPYAADVYRSGTSPDQEVWKEKENNIIEQLVPPLMDECMELILSTLEF